jgi:hypothetical protein
VKQPPTYMVVLRSPPKTPERDALRRLRHVLKRVWRQDGFRCVRVEPVGVKGK